MEREREWLEEEQTLQLQEEFRKMKKKDFQENRRKFVQAKLTELELTDDLSRATDELRETLSYISKHSPQTASQRLTDRVNEVNEPDCFSNQP